MQQKSEYFDTLREIVNLQLLTVRFKQKNNSKKKASQYVYKSATVQKTKCGVWKVFSFYSPSV